MATNNMTQTRRVVFDYEIIEFTTFGSGYILIMKFIPKNIANHKSFMVSFVFSSKDIDHATKTVWSGKTELKESLSKIYLKIKP